MGYWDDDAQGVVFNYEDFRLSETERKYLVKELTVTPGIDGPQVVLTWDIPETTSGVTIVIRRRISEYPTSSSDGIQVFSGDIYGDLSSGTGGVYRDTGVKEGRLYHYTIFSVKDSVEYYNTTTQGWSLAFSTGTYTDWYKNLLPQFYINKDREDDAQRPLEVSSSDTSDSDKLPLKLGKANITTVDSSGPLSRFLRIFGSQTDREFAQIDSLKTFYNGKKVPEDFIKYVAFLLGFSSSDVSAKKRRKELYDIVPYYKKKGTLFGIEKRFNDLFGWTAKAQSGSRQMLWSNRLDRKSSAIRTKTWDDLREGYEESLGGGCHSPGISPEFNIKNAIILTYTGTKSSSRLILNRDARLDTSYRIGGGTGWLGYYENFDNPKDPDAELILSRFSNMGELASFINDNWENLSAEVIPSMDSIPAVDAYVSGKSSQGNIFSDTPYENGVSLWLKNDDSINDRKYDGTNILKASSPNLDPKLLHNWVHVYLDIGTDEVNHKTSEVLSRLLLETLPSTAWGRMTLWEQVSETPNIITMVSDTALDVEPF